MKSFFELREGVELAEKAPKIKKASMKGDTAMNVAGKHLKTYNITMMVDGRGVMFRVEEIITGSDISQGWRTMNAAALAKLL